MIDVDLMLLGFLEKGWMTAMEELDVSHPDKRMNTLQCLILDTVTDPLWQEEDEIMHGSNNKYSVMEDERPSDQIIRYVEHHHELVDHHDQFPVEIDLIRLSGMRCKTKRKWVYHLGIVRKAWEIEREQRRENLSVITSFFQR